MRTAIYARVSTTDQNCELQLRELREYCQRREWTIAGEYVDTGFSGSKASRPELNRIMQDAGQHRFDAVLVWKIDRFGRSVLNLSEQIGQLNSWGIRFIATSQNIDTDQSNPMSRLMLHILAALSEFERELIKERVTAGVQTYRDAYRRGKIGEKRHSRSGKDLPHGRPRRIFDRRRAVEYHESGMSIRKIARKLGVGLATIQRVISEWRQENAEKAAKRVYQKSVPQKKAA